ncbi:MAG: amidase [Betaproteobacteria bacterium]|nr:amidase [Betaproteobacteria bacterium]
MKDLYKLGATEAVALLKKREVSPLELVDVSIDRIEATDGKLNAMVTRCYERARDHARRIMQEKQAQRAPGFLYGLPIAAKDNLAVAGVRSTSGSKIYADHVPAESDLVVERLEAHGAIIMGKSNMPEFAAGGNSFNDVFGATRNPWDVRTTPGGSSGGSAAALAAGQVWLATGGDFGGSIRHPASFASVSGLRPSPGMVAKIQKQPFNPLSVEGPMGRTVADVALMFDAEVGFHPEDPLSQVGPHPSFAAAAASPRKPARIAFSPDLGIAPVMDDEVRSLCRAAAQKIAQAGIAVDEKHPDLSDAGRTFLTLRGAVYIARHGGWLEKYRHVLKPEIVQNTEFGLKLSAPDVVAAEVAQGDIVRRVATFMKDYDALICPTVLCAPFDVNQRFPEQLNGVRFEGYMGWLVLTFSVTVTACPVMAVPVGFTKAGLPVGVQVIGKPRGEAPLFQVASYLEALFGVSHLTPIDPR